MKLELKDWWKPEVDEKELKDLSTRRDIYAWIHLISYFIVLVVAGFLAVASWGTWWTLPAFFVYGTVYSFSNARWHEFSHRTVFNSRRANTFFYQVFSFLCFYEAQLWRWTHGNHHRRTIHTSDPYDHEIQVPYGTGPLKLIYEFSGLRPIFSEYKKLILHSFNVMTPSAKDCVPTNHWPKVVMSSRIYLVLSLLILGFSLYIGSILPILLVITPNLYGRLLLNLTIGFPQHAGLQENALDHRLNTRNVMVNPILGFLDMNMHYHLDHHLFPQVPFYNLPKLHEKIKDQLPPSYPNLWSCYRGLIPLLLNQNREIRLTAAKN